MKDIKVVIFDLDGLMLDTERLGLEGWKYAFESLGMEISEEILLKRLGLNREDAKKVIVDAMDTEIDYTELKRLKRKYISDYAEKYGLPIKKGLLELLAYLDEMKIKKAVATSRSRDMAQKYLEIADLYGEFDYIITGDLIEKGKPAPDIFLHVSNYFNIKPSECLVLEDSINGVMAGINAKMKTIMIPDMEPSTKEVEKMIYAKCDSLLDVVELFKNYN